MHSSFFVLLIINFNERFLKRTTATLTSRAEELDYLIQPLKTKQNHFEWKTTTSTFFYKPLQEWEKITDVSMGNHPDVTLKNGKETEDRGIVG